MLRRVLTYQLAGGRPICFLYIYGTRLPLMDMGTANSSEVCQLYTHLHVITSHKSRNLYFYFSENFVFEH